MIGAGKKQEEDDDVEEHCVAVWVRQRFFSSCMVSLN